MLLYCIQLDECKLQRILCCINPSMILFELVVIIIIVIIIIVIIINIIIHITFNGFWFS